MKHIAHIQSPYKTKFGTPRQAGLVNIQAKIIFEKEYRIPEAIRGLDQFDYLWLIWAFHLADRKDWSPTVRPPRLGGNKRMGVFATRSPFRPNPLGLSSVRLLRVDTESDNAPVLYVEGADLVDGTPIYDIKPYIPYADSHPDARGGFAHHAPEKVLRVVIPPSMRQQLPDTLQAALQETISLDPRPHYQDDPLRMYSMQFDRWDVKFRVADGIAVIEDCVLNNVNAGNNS